MNNFGIRKTTAFIILGGDKHYEDWYGKLKNVKFYYDIVLSKNEMECLKDSHCSDCSSDGKCLVCHQDYHLVNGICHYNSIKDCIDGKL